MTRKEKAAPPAVTPDLREPTPLEMQAIAEARKNLRDRPVRVTVGVDRTADPATVGDPHADRDGWWDHVRDTLGTSSDGFAWTALMRLVGAAADPQKSATRLQANAALALMGAIAPENELEAAIGEQIIATHLASLDFLQRARSNAGKHFEAAAAYTNMGTKVSRAMATHVEALVKLRSGGKQQVEVRHVYIDARGGQNIIGGQVGGPDDNRRYLQQPHVPGLAFAPGAEMWSSDAAELGVPSARDAREEEVPSTRREEPRRTDGEG